MTTLFHTVPQFCSFKGLRMIFAHRYGFPYYTSNSLFTAKGLKSRKMEAVKSKKKHTVVYELEKLFVRMSEYHVKVVQQAADENERVRRKTAYFLVS